MELAYPPIYVDIRDSVNCIFLSVGLAIVGPKVSGKVT